MDELEEHKIATWRGMYEKSFPKLHSVNDCELL